MRYNRFVSRFMVFGLLALVAFSMTLLYTTSAYAKGSYRTDNQDNAGNTTRSTGQDNSSSSSSSSDTSSSRHSSQQETRRIEPAPDTSNNGGGQTNREIRRDTPPPVERSNYQPPNSGNGRQNTTDSQVYTRQETPKSDNSDQRNNHGNHNSNSGSSSSSESRYTPSSDTSNRSNTGNSSSSTSEPRYLPSNDTSNHRNSGSSSSSSSEQRNTPSNDTSNHRNLGNGSSSTSEQRYTPSNDTSNHRNLGNGSSSSIETRSNTKTNEPNSVLKSTTNHRPVDLQNGNGVNTRSDIKSNPNLGFSNIPQSSVRNDIPKSTHIPNLTGVYRKDYADLGDIWKSRRERQNNKFDNNRFNNNGRDNHNDNRSHSNVSINFNFFPDCRYQYYDYKYDPWYSYPSVYCYYTGLFPPYIYGHRVTYIHHNIVTYRYVEIPVTIIYRDSPSYRSDAADDYYLSSYRYRDLSDALRDIEKAWQNGDADLLIQHVQPDQKVDIYLKNDYSYTLESQDFEDMTRDAMSHIDTYKFDIYRVRQRDSRSVVAYAEHRYKDDDTYQRDSADSALGDNLDAKINKVYVRYTLDRIGSEWFITEVGTSPTKED